MKGDATFEYRPFLGLFGEAILFSKLAHEQRTSNKPSASYARVSILMTVFAVEAALNSALFTKPMSKRLLGRIGRFPFVDKIDFIAASFGRASQLKLDSKQITAMGELLELRNTLAHPVNRLRKMISKPTSTGGPHYEESVREYSPLLSIPKVSDEWGADSARIALQTADAFLEHYFVEICAVENSLRGHIFLCSLRGDNGWTATISQKEAHEQVRYAQAEYKLRCAFLPNYSAK